MEKLISIDIGTSSTRTVLFDKNGSIDAIAQEELSLKYPQPGWVEQCPTEMVDKTVKTLCKILNDHDVKTIASIGITNQRETTIIWDRKTGIPIYNAIVWQDRRTSELCTTLKREGLEKEIQKKTGLLLDPYFSATKIKWILDNVEGAKEKAKNGDLLFGTVDCYILWHLTGGKSHKTDLTNASRTMLYNIKTLKWDKNLLETFEIPYEIMPKTQDNTSDFGRIDSGINTHQIQINGMAGDQQSALIGQGCIESGMMKSTYGTGCFSLINTGKNAVQSHNKIITTIGYRTKKDIAYALEGSIFNAGTAIQFLRDNFNFIDNAKQSEEMAQSLSDNGGVYFAPAFTGLGAPHWNPDAKGMIYGLHRDTSKAHIVRAALEAQAYQTRDLFTAMEQDSNKKTDKLRADGGLVKNTFMCQFLSDILGITVEIPTVTESTAWGAACLAGIQSGVFSDLKDATSNWKPSRTYTPTQSKDSVDKLYKKWCEVVSKL